MAAFLNTKDSLKEFPKKVIKYYGVGFILLGISYGFLYFIETALDQEIFGSLSSILGIIRLNLINVIIILLISLPTFLILYYIRNKSKILMISMLFIAIFTIGLLSIAMWLYNLSGVPFFNIIGDFYLDIVLSINNLIPFLIILPFILIFYFRKIKSSSKFKLTNLKIRNQVLLIDDGRQKKFKGISILQIKNIPRNISIKEVRTRKKNIEKLMIPGDYQYLHYHLTSLAKTIPNLTFEIRVLNNDIKLRIIFTLVESEINDLIRKLEILREVIVTVFHTTFPGLKFNVLEGRQLKDAWGDIFGGWGNFKLKFTKENKIAIDKVLENTFISIVQFDGHPFFKISNKKSQIDALIRGLIGSHFNLSYVISAIPVEIYNFEKQQEKLERKAGTVGQQVYGTRSRYGFRFKSGVSLKDKLEEEYVREELLNIRHAEITGMWNVSGYVIIRSDDIDKCESDTQKVSALISTVFGVECKILESPKLQNLFSCIPMRSPLNKPLNLTSEQLAIFFHLPENPIPSLSRIDIPEFEVPPERKVMDGIVLGKILLYEQEMYPVQLTIEDLRLNTFICGLIGMGKSRLTMNILKQLAEKHQEINWFCLDWKGEYQYLKNEITARDIKILIPGSESAPIKLNMFDPQRSNGDEHARKLFAIIREVFKSEFNRQSELTSQMESVCKEVLRRVVNNPKERSLSSFIAELRNYARENQKNNRTIIMTVTALINRFDKFRHGILKTIFDVKKSNINFDLIMEEKVIVNLNHLLTKGGAKEDVRLVMNLILKYIIDKALKRGVTDGLKHIVIIEDAQFLIPSVLREVPETSLVEDIPLLLRGVGESLITIATRPEVSSDVIANSGVKISFKSPYDSQKIA
ncbi:MAG: ATP-binding protein, partial [Candidatus Helarchaeota archaeon]